jgi:hypothetical protein
MTNKSTPFHKRGRGGEQEQEEKETASLLLKTAQENKSDKI